MKKKFIVKSNSKFQLIFKKGRTVGNPNFVVYYLQNNLSFNRFGFAVAKKNHGAVKRNKARRQLKMMVHGIMTSQKLALGYDIVIITRKSFSTTAFSKNQQLLEKVLLKIK